MSKLHKNKQYYQKTGQTVKQVRQELNEGLALLNKIKRPIVTIFGSHQVRPSHKYYKHGRSLGYQLGQAGYAVMTGGGPGVMQAANQGAKEAGTVSVGIREKLIKREKVSAPIYTQHLSFRFLFIRRFILSIKSEAMIFYPGGYGTLNELFEFLVLIQTGIVDRVPLICVNKKFWRGLFDWIDKNPLRQHLLTNNIRDLKLLYFIDNAEEIIQLIKKSSR